MTDREIGDSALFAPIEPYVAELASSPELPALAIGLCTLRYPASVPLLRAIVQRAADGGLAGEEEERQFFRALFIVGGRRDPLAFQPLLRFLRRAHDEVEFLLGDAITEVLAQIAAGVFDGDSEALLEAAVDPELDEYVRDALLGAATFLTWEGRIERPTMVRLLQRFHAERLAPDGDMAWYSWARAIGLLGLRDMEAAVLGAWDRLPDRVMEREDFQADLVQAEREPGEIGRFKKGHNFGYIDDVLEVLGHLDFVDDATNSDPEWGPTTPVVNPWRHVGRNDPRPCGSGKKAKRCCLES